MKKTPNARKNLLVSVEKLRDLSGQDLAKVVGGQCPGGSCDNSDKPCPHTHNN